MLFNPCDDDAAGYALDFDTLDSIRESVGDGFTGDVDNGARGFTGDFALTIFSNFDNDVIVAVANDIPAHAMINVVIRQDCAF